DQPGHGRDRARPGSRPPAPRREGPLTPDELVAQAEALARDGMAAVDAAGSLDDLAALERRLLGKGGLATIKEAIKAVAPEDRARVGKALGHARASIDEALQLRRARLETAASAGAAERERIDLTLGGRGVERGHLHLVTQVWRELEDIFTGLGYG